DDRAKVDAAFKEVLDSQTIRSAVSGRLFVHERKISTVLLWSRSGYLAGARRQADGTYEVVKADAAQATESDEKAPRWHVYTSVDRVEGATADMISARSEKDDGLLSVRCSENKSELIVHWAHYVGNDNSLIYWRLDNGPRSLEHWPTSPSGRTVFAPQ